MTSSSDSSTKDTRSSKSPSALIDGLALLYDYAFSAVEGKNDYEEERLTKAHDAIYKALESSTDDDVREKVSALEPDHVRDYKEYVDKAQVLAILNEAKAKSSTTSSSEASQKEEES